MHLKHSTVHCPAAIQSPLKQGRRGFGLNKGLYLSTLSSQVNWPATRQASGSLDCSLPPNKSGIPASGGCLVPTTGQPNSGAELAWDPLDPKLFSLPPLADREPDLGPA